MISWLSRVVFCTSYLCTWVTHRFLLKFCNSYSNHFWCISNYSTDINIGTGIFAYSSCVSISKLNFKWSKQNNKIQISGEQYLLECEVRDAFSAEHGLLCVYTALPHSVEGTGICFWGHFHRRSQWWLSASWHLLSCKYSMDLEHTWVPGGLPGEWTVLI